MASNGISSSSGLTNPSLNNNVFDSSNSTPHGHTGNGSVGLLSKRFNSTSLAVGPLGNLGDHLNTSLNPYEKNPYEKWSNGSDKMFDHHTSDSILELSSKLLTLGENLLKSMDANFTEQPVTKVEFFSDLELRNELFPANNLNF